MSVEISFILGIYNAERTLRECMDSILKQDFPKSKYEILVIDGGSKDSTLDIVKSYMSKNKNISLYHNPKKLSEGRGMSKDMGVKKAKGKIIIFLDHDNILLGENWLNEILEPFKNKSIMASQSLLQPMKKDSLFLQYVNALGVEDPFAVPYSLVSQVTLKPQNFEKTSSYYKFTITPNHILFIGANGCAFRKEVFKTIGCYTRDVDVSADMAKHSMEVAIPFTAKIYHKTSNDLFSFLKKKGLYFYRFINKEFESKSFKWNKVGNPPSTLRYFLMVLLNLSIISPMIEIFPLFFKTGKIYWLLHPFYVFFVTLEYSFISLFKIKNFVKYL